MLFKKVKTVQAFNGKRFVAAYSSVPFTEAPSGETQTVYPDYAFYKKDGLYWCVRVGEMKIPWGVGRLDGVPYFANGVLVIERGNQSVESWDGLNLPYKKEGDLFRLYESEYVQGKWVGFCSELNSRVLPCLVRIAKSSKLESLDTDLEQGARVLLQKELSPFGVSLKSVKIEKKGTYKETK